MKKISLFILLQIIIVYGKRPVKYNESRSASKYNNPNFVRDRLKKLIVKPPMPGDWMNRFRKPYNPAWMDYCDPYHCNDYHRPACGLNRATMRFKWFQSVCHLILNNKCAHYRGFLKFDIIEPKFCAALVMFLRQGCPISCEDKELDPKCGFNMADGHVVLFKNQCSLDAANCRGGVLDEYENVDMDICEYYVQQAL